MSQFIFAGTENFVDKRIPSLSNSLVNNLLLIVLGSWSLAILAQVVIPLGFTPVPITGQTFGVLLIGGLFGAKRSALTITLYLAQGALGLPFFAKGASGILVFFGPTGGYLLGMLVAGIVMGYFADRKHDQKLQSSIPLFLMGHLIIFAFGLAWLGKFIGYQNVISLGFIPFVPGLVIKTLVVAAITKAIRK